MVHRQCQKKHDQEKEDAEMEKVINKLGPRLAESLGPVVLAFLVANPWLIPVILLGGAAAAAVIAKATRKAEG